MPRPPKTFLALAIAAVGGVGLLPAATPIPGWHLEAGTTRQGYEYTSDTISPIADVLENAYGTPVSTVTLGEFSDGWQDPANSVDLSGVANDGAWDLGISGYIEVEVPFAPMPAGSGSHYRVDFLAYAVGYRGITGLPAFQAVGLSANDLALDQETVANDPEFPGATWEGLAWSGYFDNVTSDTMTVRFDAPSNNIAVVDTVEVFTHYTLIPEPSVTLLLVAMGIMTIRRRSRG